MKLIQGDCLEEMKNIPDGSVDMVLTDPPYGTTACKWDSIIPLEPLWEQLKRVIKPNGAIVMTASQPLTTTLIGSNLDDFKYEMIYKKPSPSNPLVAKKQVLKYHENVVVFYSKQPTFNPQKSAKNDKNRRNNKRVNYEQGGVFGSTKMMAGDGNRDWVYDGSVVSIKKRERGLHPTQKPVALMEYLIKTYTNEGETVLDFTMGSGTTGVACKNLNRDFIGIELDPEYFRIAKERIEQYDVPEG